MQFSDSTNKQGLVEEIDFLVSGSSSSPVTSYTIADRTRNINQWNAKVIGWIFSAANPRFQFDDSNYGTMPYAVANLQSGVASYRLDAGWLSVNRIDILDGQGKWITLGSFDSVDIPEAYDSYLSTAGTPQRYDLTGDVLTLKPTPNYTQSGGLKVWFERIGNNFATNDTTRIPGFNSDYHRVLSLGAAYDWAISHDMKRANTLRQEINAIKEEIEEFYGMRNKSEKLQLRPLRQSFK